MSEPEGSSKRLELALEVVRNGVFPAQPARLSRRNRHVIVDADFYGDYGVVWFVRSGSRGEPIDEFFKLDCTSGAWKSNGISGREPGVDLENRPTSAAIAEINSHGGFDDLCPFGLSGGGSSDFKGRPASVHLQLAPEVAELRFSDRAPKTVTAHGGVVLLYQSRALPEVTAFDKNGQSLGSYIPRSWDDYRRSKRLRRPIFRRRSNTDTYGAGR